jgi:S-adenosylmethionine:tRNA ribosyltransferase-isomerase
VRPATWPRDDTADERLLIVDGARGAWSHERVRDLPDALRPGDLVIVNDAATIPASLAGHVEGTSVARIEMRLLAMAADDAWNAVLFGGGSWRTRTEDRPPPPRVHEGARLVFAPDLKARVVSVDPRSERLVVVRFEGGGAELWRALYRHGKPVQYAYVSAPLELWHVQTRFASRPWAVEMPSAGRPLSWALLERLRARGVELATLTHAAGLSSTGEARIDELLPLPERYEIPRATVDAIGHARERRGRVIAIGTTVARALEGSARSNVGRVVAGKGITDLRLDARFEPRVVDAIMTGMHAPPESHFDLACAFAPRPLLERALADAADTYLAHEFGDSMLILR